MNKSNVLFIGAFTPKGREIIVENLHNGYNALFAETDSQARIIAENNDLKLCVLLDWILDQDGNVRFNPFEIAKFLLSTEQEVMLVKIDQCEGIVRTRNIDPLELHKYNFNLKQLSGYENFIYSEVSLEQFVFLIDYFTDEYYVSSVYNFEETSGCTDPANSSAYEQFGPFLICKN